MTTQCKKLIDACTEAFASFRVLDSQKASIPAVQAARRSYDLARKKLDTYLEKRLK